MVVVWLLVVLHLSPTGGARHGLVVEDKTGLLALPIFKSVGGGVGGRILGRSRGSRRRGRYDYPQDSLLVPCSGVVLFFFFNALICGEKSSGVVPFTTMFALVLLCFGISVPLVFVGNCIGFKKPAIEDLVKTNKIPWQIPEQGWYMNPIFSILIGGILPFGAVFIELFFILTSIWLHQSYYIFGFLFLVFIILSVTYAEITIVLFYFQLCREDYL
ncbi:hypothetical protein Taro_027587 [Colocasia esculenta]|uniref:Transmembrane 9 superfamily member n=1 Tax=Colocasia esculenta TaxID=4460 RepID=A0A843VMX3_COLES|nr:hypothetical protein [Colocasia esculenta]